MALINCPECGVEVSNKATQCIKCGAPVEIPIKKRGMLARMISKKIKCPNCSYVGKPGRVGVSAGSCLILIVLLLCFIVPGVIYMIWLDSHSAKLQCPKCKNKNVITI